MDQDFPVELRCKHCRRLVGKASGGSIVLELHCPRCKKNTIFRLTVDSVAAPVAQLAG